MTDAQRKSIINQLNEEFFSDITIEDSEILCNVMVEAHSVKFKCTLPLAFPYVLPTIYINEDSYRNIAPLPHVNFDFSICTFDKGKIIPNFKEPVQVILASLIQAKEIIRQGILKENIEDFYEEFNAYWRLECDGEAESIFELINSPVEINCYFNGKKVYIANTKADLDKYLSNIGIKKRYLSDYHNCLYLPLNVRFCPPFPKTNYDLYCLVKSDVTNFEIYNKFLKKCIPQGAFIAFSVEHGKKRCLQLWMHTGISTQIKGFRKNHAPVEIAYLRDTKKAVPIKFDVENMSQERLFTRGGAGLTKLLSEVTIIGCGSVGSFIIEALSEYGVSHFYLVDNEKLSTENIARHYCGYTYVNTPKVSAVKAELARHNPNINCEAFQIDAHHFIEKHIDIINSSDIVFVATADTPLEYRIIEMMNKNQVEKPLIVVWVEPFLVAGHALVLNKPQDIFSEFFNENLYFQRSVLINGEEFSMKEVGCQSTFMPYSAFVLKRFIYAFLDYLLNQIIAQEKQGNYHFTWCGDLFNAQKQGCTIASLWKDATPYSTHVKRID